MQEVVIRFNINEEHGTLAGVQIVKNTTALPSNSLLITSLAWGLLESMIVNKDDIALQQEMLNLGVKFSLDPPEE